jgi:hypothetical protein
MTRRRYLQQAGHWPQQLSPQHAAPQQSAQHAGHWSQHAAPPQHPAPPAFAAVASPAPPSEVTTRNKPFRRMDVMAVPFSVRVRATAHVANR